MPSGTIHEMLSGYRYRSDIAMNSGTPGTVVSRDRYMSKSVHSSAERENCSSSPGHTVILKISRSSPPGIGSPYSSHSQPSEPWWGDPGRAGAVS